MRLLYDRKWVAVYDDIVNSGYYDYLEEAKIIANIAGKRKTFLELGSGTGNLVLALVSLGKDVTGMDNSPVMNKAFEKRSRNKNSRSLFYSVTNAGWIWGKIGR